MIQGDSTVVAPGDSFATIAAAVLQAALGRAPDPAEVVSYVEVLIDVNRDRLLPPFNPDLLYPGQVVALPPIDASVEADGAERVTADPAPVPVTGSGWVVPQPGEVPERVDLPSAGPPPSWPSGNAGQTIDEGSSGSDGRLRLLLSVAVIVMAGAFVLSHRHRRPSLHPFLDQPQPWPRTGTGAAPLTPGPDTATQPTAGTERNPKEPFVERSGLGSDLPGDAAGSTVDLDELTGSVISGGEPEPAASCSEMTETQGGPVDHCDAVIAGDPFVRVLGTVRVAGVAGEFRLRRCAELIVYLALHRSGVDADTMMEVLWPEERPDANRLHRLVSAARAGLGNDPEGGPYLPRVGADGLYRISPRVGCDLEQLMDHTQRAQAIAGDEAMEHLRAGLNLVEGPPFSKTNGGYEWVHAEGFAAHALVTIDKAAHRLGEAALEACDTGTAGWAARKGIATTGSCEHCYRILMRAAIADADWSGLEAIYAELIAVLNVDGDGEGVVDDETVELYRAHSRRYRRRR